MKTLKSLPALLLLPLIFAGAVQSDQKINGWFFSGSTPGQYTLNLDNQVFKSGTKSASIQSSVEKPEGFSTVMQICNAKNYLGTKIKMTGYIKSKNVTDWSGMWLRIDSKNPGETLGFDNMQDRPVQGDSDWTKCEIIMDVPEESITLNFGALLSGPGKIWFDNVSIEIFDNAVPKTPREPVVSYYSDKPVNTDFEE